MGLNSKEKKIQDVVQTLVFIIKHRQQHILSQTGKLSEQMDLLYKG
jgi:hypothetical protein